MESSKSGSTSSVSARIDPLEHMASQILSPEAQPGALALQATSMDNVAWQDFAEHEYLFDPVPWGEDDGPPLPDYLRDLALFRPGTFNLGLRLVHRQEWRALGNQRGEIVRTIPLGPRQIERVSTKTVRRTRVIRTAESLHSEETTSETSDTTKDSSEVMREAASTFNWHVNAEATLDIGVFQGRVDAGMAGSTEERSRQTNRKLSEVMQKTASRIRRETKTVVSTESESSYEVTTASEISNPNEEIAVTYIYSKLQRQFEVMTQLVDVDNVVFVALPMPPSIDVAWVRRHDWILAKALLDDSFREALGLVSTEPAYAIDVDACRQRILAYDAELERDPSDPYEVLSSTSVTTLSLTGTDLAQESENYRNTIRAQRERTQAELSRAHKVQRLLDHIRDNVLHYMRAVWSHEDSEMRLLRLRRLNVRVPRSWEFFGVCGEIDTGTAEAEGRPGAAVRDVLQQLVARELEGQPEADAPTETALGATPDTAARASSATAPPEIGIDDPFVIEMQAIEVEIAKEREARITTESRTIQQAHERRLETTLGPLQSARDEALSNAKISARNLVMERRVPELMSALAELEARTAPQVTEYLRVQQHWNATKPPFAETIRATIDPSRPSTVRDAASHLRNRTDHEYELHKALFFLPIASNMLAASGWLDTLLTALAPPCEEEARLARGPEELYADEIAAETAVSQASVRRDYDAKVALATAELEAERDAELIAAAQRINAELDTTLETRKAWIRAKWASGDESRMRFHGHFETATDTSVNLVDVLNPAGPVGYHGNYAIYLLKRDADVPDIQGIIDVLKTPFLHYRSRGEEPRVMDPYLKRLTRQYADIVPDRGIREEMLTYVPRLRQLHETARLSAPEPTGSGQAESVERFFADDRLFREHYSEYLFRRELTQRFPVDTNNLLIDVELGRGSVLETFKLAHRGIDVQRAHAEKERLRAENTRMQHLLARGDLDARYWPEGRKIIAMGLPGELGLTTGGAPVLVPPAGPVAADGNAGSPPVHEGGAAPLGPPYPRGVFVANLSTREVHTGTCWWGQQIAPGHRVLLTNLELALRQGMSRCQHCLEPEPSS